MIRALLFLVILAALADSPTARAVPTPSRPLRGLELRPLTSEEGYLNWRTIVVIDGKVFEWNDCPRIDGMRATGIEKEGDYIRVLELRSANGR